jgi:hypothetical protein
MSGRLVVQTAGQAPPKWIAYVRRRKLTSVIAPISNVAQSLRHAPLLWLCHYATLLIGAITDVRFRLLHGILSILHQPADIDRSGN